VGERWRGEGTIQLNLATEMIPFTMHWRIERVKDNDSDRIECDQTILVEGHADPVKNRFAIFNVQGAAFCIQLMNNTVGQVEGIGLAGEQVIAWEFRSMEDFEGFEFYEKQNEQTYLMRAEYTTECLRTSIRGILRKEVGV